MQLSASAPDQHGGQFSCLTFTGLLPPDILTGDSIFSSTLLRYFNMKPSTYMYMLTTLVGIACCQECLYEIVESMPDQLKFNSSINIQPTPTHESLIDIINNTRKTLRIASFYWTLSAEPQYAFHQSTEAGRKIMECVESAGRRGVRVEVILDNSSRKSMNNLDDVKLLETIGTVKYLNMTKLLKSGLLHSKFLIADNETFYIGSSNFDWRSYTQIKEIGIRMTKCAEIAQDLDRIFETYWFMSDLNHVPDTFPDYLMTKINADNPIYLSLDRMDARLFLAGAPPAFNGVREHWTGRTDDIDGLLRIVERAKHQIDISVMNYSPTTEFIWPKKFWPRIDNALRKAASERKVRVRLLFSDWAHNKEEEIMWYKSLNAVQSKALGGGGIHVKMFKVPSYDDFQRKLPYARVKHDKYLVTDRALYIGTSNWAPDYFINTCGVSINIEPREQNESALTIIKGMQELFARDFNSEFSHELA